SSLHPLLQPSWQDGCNRGCNDESVSISNVERYVGDYMLENSDKFYQAPENETDKNVAIVGAGPSGLTAAYFMRKAGAKVTVFEKMPEAGGMLMYAIPHYRLPKTYVKQYIAALGKMGIEFVYNTSIGETITPAQLENDFDSVYYATGAWKRPFLGLDGEDLTVFGLDFLVQVNKWMVDKVGTHVLVTGGGNVAMDVAITAKRLGAKSVTLACLESEKEMPASKEEIARAREEGIVVMPSWGLSKVVSEDKKVIGMELKRCTSVKDDSGRFNPQYDETDKTVVYADAILMAVGQKVDLSFLGDKYDLALQRGLIEVEDETQSTSRAGVYAGGDATSGPATVVKGVAAGHKAANGMINYLGMLGNGSCEGKNEKDEKFLKFDLEGKQNTIAAKLHERTMEMRNIKEEDSQGLTKEEALSEASRCMNCGCYAVNPSDIAPALVALDATIKTNIREISANDFCTEKLKVTDVLYPGEIVEEINVPLVVGAKMHYDKFRLRNSIDFAIVSVASMYAVEKGKISGARIVLGGVAPMPLRVPSVEGYIIGKEVNEAMAQEAAEIAVRDALAMDNNAYKIQEVRALLKNSILRMKA
ncbi:MAG TPA: FAD-dependent oxidoreductase, partial [Anaerovoracaceae bacterium]|nr:FAD-dependent oxidoreductase [Anaerovoracaceae bacterium]